VAVKILGHPIHPMLVVFPLGLLSTAVIFDLLFVLLATPELPVVSYWLIIAGLVGGLAAALFGFIDWLAIPGGTRAKTLGIIHGIGNLIIVVMFLVSWFLRRDNPDYIPDTLALVLGIGGVVLVLVTAWLGVELVYRLGVGVDTGSQLNAPSTITNPTSGGKVNR